ncbi:MAG: hypothetical protein WCL16_14025 [bacterium]
MTEAKPVYVTEPTADRQPPPFAPGTWRHDPALSLDIATLKDLALAAGAAEVVIVRQLCAPRLTWYTADGQMHGVKPPGDRAGTVVLITFAAQDDGVGIVRFTT